MPLSHYYCGRGVKMCRWCARAWEEIIVVLEQLRVLAAMRNERGWAGRGSSPRGKLSPANERCALTCQQPIRGSDLAGVSRPYIFIILVWRCNIVTTSSHHHYTIHTFLLPRRYFAPISGRHHNYRNFNKNEKEMFQLYQQQTLYFCSLGWNSLSR